MIDCSPRPGVGGPPRPGVAPVTPPRFTARNPEEVVGQYRIRIDLALAGTTFAHFSGVPLKAAAGQRRRLSCRLIDGKKLSSIDLFHIGWSSAASTEIPPVTPKRVSPRGTPEEVVRSLVLSHKICQCHSTADRTSWMRARTSSPHSSGFRKSACWPWGTGAPFPGRGRPSDGGKIAN